MIERDGYSYDRATNPTIDICLSCTNEKCIGICDKVRGEVVREFVVKRKYTTAKGIEKESYILHVGKKGVTSTTNIFRAKLRSYDGAMAVKSRAKAILSSGVTLEIVKRSEEVAEITKENKKTKRDDCRLYADANGNLLGRGK